MAKHFNLEAETGHYQLTGHAAALTYSTIRTTIEKNWLLIISYVAITIASWILSYFTSGWTSVGLSVAVTVITFAVGWYMVQQVVTITNEIR